MVEKDAVSELTELYADEKAVQNFFNYLAERGNNARQTTVEKAMEAGLSRNRAIQLLRELGKLGLGVFKTGRKGHKSRLVWAENVDVRDLGKAVREGRSNGFPSTSPDAEQRSADSLTRRATPPVFTFDNAEQESGTPPRVEGDKLVEHPYLLRSGVWIRVRVPSNLTQAEASRLARFIETIPFS